ncbi:MAG TPA: nitrogen fixation protein NifH [Chloroflexota bacterium]|nr:nitrogen fixation protein NifH [Chloroflexota bacterium]
MDANWKALLTGDPLPWLLEDDTPAVRHATLRTLMGKADDDPEVRSALATAMSQGPIATILEAQNPDGYWAKPGAGYGPKYQGTVWQLVFLDQLSADPHAPAVKLACEYVLAHCQTSTGAFGCSAARTLAPPPPSAAIHCLHGNLLRALLGFGYFDDVRVRQAIDWQARSITGDGFGRYYQSSTSGPDCACAANGKKPCAWGAVKALLALARIPAEKRDEPVASAIDRVVELLLSRDPAIADYPTTFEGQRPSGAWFQLGFPLGYVTDVLQNLEALCEAGFAGDPRLRNAVDWLLSKQDRQGRWSNRHAYNGKTWGDIERQGAPSKWVTLRACHVLQMMA